MSVWRSAADTDTINKPEIVSLTPIPSQKRASIQCRPTLCLDTSQPCIYYYVYRFDVTALGRVAWIKWRPSIHRRPLSAKEELLISQWNDTCSFSARGKLRTAAPNGALPGLLRHRLQHQTLGASSRGAQLRQGVGRKGEKELHYIKLAIQI